MMSIGELAAAAGTTARAVRHYHSLGLLAEPARRLNGYREYDTHALVRLVRVRRLVALGLSLPEVGCALGPGGDQDLREVLREVAADLVEQQRRVAEAQQRIAEVLAREDDLDLSPAVASLMVVVRAALPGSAWQEAVERERTTLSVVEASLSPQMLGEVTEQMRASGDDAAVVARTRDLSARFDALAQGAVDDPAVAEVAGDLAASAAGLSAAGAVDAAGQQLWSDYVASLPPAQARCLRLAETMTPGNPDG